MVRTKQYYKTKIVLRILQLLLMLYSNVVKKILNYLPDLPRRMSCKNSKKSKKLFTVKLILKIYIPSLLTVVKIDVLDFVLGVYLV